ncbi:hypothetical protein ABIA31_000209 [Catenulispora sp. MAP5-51]|uniref:hypothetical protein n=1 Tax=Catenulispora sp. MAP5-51 TaxID=3156298 RepID=UPI0035197A3F
MATLSEDEVQVVVQLVERCLTHERTTWAQVMRHARLLTPGTVVRSRTTRPAMSRTYAYQHALASGLLYAEGVAHHRGFAHERMGWCVDADTGVVVEPTFLEPGTAYFGVVLRPEFMLRAVEAHRYDDGEDGFRGVYHMFCMEPDPAVDMVHDLGRDIPASVRDWALSADLQPRPGSAELPAWLWEELRRQDSEKTATGQRRDDGGQSSEP